jgi:hypothetical protein
MAQKVGSLAKLLSSVLLLDLLVAMEESAPASKMARTTPEVKAYTLEPIDVSLLERIEVDQLESLILWVAFSPQQYEDLNEGKEVIPDGLRRTMLKAVERAHLFMDWSPKGGKGETHPKDYVAVQIEISPLWYMRKMEAGILLKFKPNEYRWTGPIKSFECDTDGRWLYRFRGSAQRFV